jgi:hypothetical protein
LAPECLATRREPYPVDQPPVGSAASALGLQTVELPLADMFAQAAKPFFSRAFTVKQIRNASA